MPNQRITFLIAALLAIQVSAPLLAADTTPDHREQFILSEINPIVMGFLGRVGHNPGDSFATAVQNSPRTAQG